jgi:hypothetical protein
MRRSTVGPFPSVSVPCLPQFPWAGAVPRYVGSLMELGQIYLLSQLMFILGSIYLRFWQQNFIKYKYGLRLVYTSDFAFYYPTYENKISFLNKN